MAIAPISRTSEVPAQLINRLNDSSEIERAAAVMDLTRVGGDDAFRLISNAFDDESPEVRKAAARALYDLRPDRASSFTRALREGTPERRRNIGASLTSSGIASEALSTLIGDGRDKTYNAFSILFLMAKCGEIQPLIKAIEEDPNTELRLALIKLLSLSGQPELIAIFRRLAVRSSLPAEVRSSLMESIYRISTKSEQTSTSVA